jgi:hypothetical protein
LVARFGSRHAWLSITPEPERELPAAVAELREGGPPCPASVAAEEARVERLVTRGSRGAWAAYLTEALDLARAAPPGPARELVLDVIDNHDNLKLGLPGGRA